LRANNFKVKKVNIENSKPHGRPIWWRSFNIFLPQIAVFVQYSVDVILRWTSKNMICKHSISKNEVAFTAGQNNSPTFERPNGYYSSLKLK